MPNLFSHSGVKEHEPLSRHTTMRVGGPARFFATATSSKEAGDLLREARAASLPVYILGNGSDVVFSDAGFNGLVMLMQNRGLEVRGLEIRAEAGVVLSLLLAKAKHHGLSGLECIAGIPGTVGGGIWANAGMKDGAISDHLTSVTYINRTNEQQKTARPSELSFSYRDSFFKHHETLILEATFTLQEATPDDVQKRIQDLMGNRTVQPTQHPNSGSVFRNPPGDFSARLIESCKLKGLRVGGAEVSEQHANFIVNRGTATAKDVYELMRKVQTAVHERHGALLVPEVEFIGFER